MAVLTSPAHAAWQRLGRGWAVTPLVVVAVSRVIALVVAWASMKPGQQFAGKFAAWDGGWYESIARFGYGPAPLGGAVVHPWQRMVFLPVVPMSARVVSEVTPFGALEAGVLLSVLSTFLAGVLLWRLVERRMGAEVATVTLALVVLSPHAIVLSMFYTDGPMLLAVVLTFLLLERRQWWAAGSVSLVGGLVRPNAFVLAVPCLIEAVRARRLGEATGWKPFVATMLTPLGFVAWVLFTAHRTGDLMGYFHLQDVGWGSRVDGGVATVKAMGRMFAGNSLDTMEAVNSVSILIIGIGGLILAWRVRVPPAWLGYAAAMVLLVSVNARQTSAARFLLTAFPLFVGWAKATPPLLRPLVVGVSAAAMALLGFLTYTTRKYGP